jgi:superfamily II DNA/RNA helicase
VEPDEADGTRTTHEFVRTRREDRVELTAELVATYGSTVVFCRTRHGADRVAGQLSRRGIKAVPIHGGRSQGQRDRALRSFADGQAQALVATDVAARGIHVDNVGCVVHYDVAGDHKDYLHRSGRTGRAGATGVVVSLVTDSDVAGARLLQRAVGLPVEPDTSPTRAPADRRPPMGAATRTETGRSRRGNGKKRARYRGRTLSR